MAVNSCIMMGGGGGGTTNYSTYSDSFDEKLVLACCPGTDPSGKAVNNIIEVPMYIGIYPLETKLRSFSLREAAKWTTVNELTPSNEGESDEGETVESTPQYLPTNTELEYLGCTIFQQLVEKEAAADYPSDVNNIPTRAMTWIIPTFAPPEGTGNITNLDQFGFVDMAGSFSVGYKNEKTIEPGLAFFNRTYAQMDTFCTYRRMINVSGGSNTYVYESGPIVGNTCNYKPNILFTSTIATDLKRIMPENGNTSQLVKFPVSQRMSLLTSDKSVSVTYAALGRGSMYSFGTPTSGDDAIFKNARSVACGWALSKKATASSSHNYTNLSSGIHKADIKTQYIGGSYAVLMRNEDTNTTFLRVVLPTDNVKFMRANNVQIKLSGNQLQLEKAVGPSDSTAIDKRRTALENKYYVTYTLTPGYCGAYFDIPSYPASESNPVGTIFFIYNKGTSTFYTITVSNNTEPTFTPV